MIHAKYTTDNVFIEDADPYPAAMARRSVLSLVPEWYDNGYSEVIEFYVTRSREVKFNWTISLGKYILHAKQNSSIRGMGGNRAKIKTCSRMRTYDKHIALVQKESQNAQIFGFRAIINLLPFARVLNVRMRLVRITSDLLRNPII